MPLTTELLTVATPDLAATRLPMLCRLWHNWETQAETEIGFPLYCVTQRCTRCGKTRQQICDEWDQTTGI
jgi:hypothetical protein